MGFFTKTINHMFRRATITTNIVASSPKVKGRPVTLNLADKQEPFGAIDIAEVKQALEDEDFAQLQSLYFYMMRDAKIASSILTRKQPLLSMPYSITTDNTEFAEFIAQHVDLDALLNHLTHAVYYGVSLVDVDYQVVEQKLAPTFRHISSRYLYADREDGKLKPTRDHIYIKQGNEKRYISQLIPERYIFHKHPIDIGEITDFSLASKLVWFFTLKHITIAHNMQYFDATATPPLIMKTEGDEDEAVDMLYMVKSQSTAVIDRADEISYLTIGQGSKTEFLNFIHYIDSQITTLVLGNTLSTGDGKTGSYSQSKVHENRQREIKLFDAKLIGKTITQYLNQLEKLNYANPKGVTFTFDVAQKQDLKALSEVILNLSEAGFDLDESDIGQRFGFKVTRKESQLSRNQRASHSIVKSTNRQLPEYDDELARQTPIHDHDQALVEHIMKLLTQVDSYEAAYQQLLDLYTDLDVSQLEASLFQAMANSQILADAQIQQESGQEENEDDHA